MKLRALLTEHEFCPESFCTFLKYIGLPVITCCFVMASYTSLSPIASRPPSNFAKTSADARASAARARSSVAS